MGNTIGTMQDVYVHIKVIGWKWLYGKLWNGQYKSPLDISGSSTGKELNWELQSNHYWICTFDKGWLVNWLYGYVQLLDWSIWYPGQIRDSLLSRDPLQYLKTILYSSILSKIWTYLSLSSLKKLNLCEIWHPLLEIKSHFLLKINASAEQVFDKSSCCLIMEKCN